MISLVALVLFSLPGDKEPEPPKRTLRLTLREAVSFALNHNLDIEVARYQPWIEDQNVLAALGTWDHVAYAAATGGETIAPGFSALSGATKLDTDEQDFTLGVRQTLPLGASYDFSLTSDRSLSNNSFLLVNPRWSQSAGVALTLPLLKGGSTVANTSTFLVARHTRDISQNVFEKALADSVFQVTQAYWDLVFAVENKKVKDQSVEVSQKLLQDNRKKLERGVVARIEVTQAEAEVAAQQEGILTAEAAVQNAMDRLKRLIDASLLSEEITLSPIDAPGSLMEPIDEKKAVEQAWKEALESRPEVRHVRNQLAAQDVTLAKAENDLLPKFDLTGRAFLLGTDDTFGRANDETRSRDFHELAVGLVFEWPLERSAAKGTIRRADLEKRRLQLQQRNLDNQILVEVREAVRAIKTNEKRIEATRRARVLAKEQIEAEQTRHDQGLSTTFRVLDAKEDLAQARTNELKALIDYNLSRHRLQQAAGTLLAANGIVLKENLQPRMTP